MKARARLVVAGMLASLGIVGLLALFLSLAAKPSRESAPPRPRQESPPIEGVSSERDGEAQGNEVQRRDESKGNEARDSGSAPEVEEPIEVLLADGEDPGAVIYMSRIREALREGNPAFARELLRQMKETHTASILLSEAEALIEERR